MNAPHLVPGSRDKVLFTPGPLTTSLPVKAAMLHDAGSWHYEFNEKVQAIREKILALAGVSRATGWESILMQGTGTFGVEAVFASAIPPHGKVLVLANGAYGERMIMMLKALRIAHSVLRTAEDTPPTAAAVKSMLATETDITHVAMVHMETTTGILNPIQEIGQVVKSAGRIFVLDAISSFGALPIDLEACGVQFMISSANKCIEGVPGFSFVICKRQSILACEGFARSLSLDLIGQLKGFEKNGQFRYTPPTHSILAFEQALLELDAEGGIPGRLARYMHNHEVLVAGMKKIGFKVYLKPEVQSPVITSFIFPKDPNFTFEGLYRRLSDRGFIIYPGKISQADTFRIGSIGRIFESDTKALIGAIAESLAEMSVNMQA